MLKRLVHHIRKNHALEHATIALLIRGGAARPPLAGYSTPGGFYLYGDVETEAVTQAAREALDRLRAGQADLALSPFCGTNLLVGAVLTTVATALTLGRHDRYRRLSSAITASALSLVAAPLLGRWLQQRFTTLAEVDDVEVASVTRREPFGHTLHHVRTRQAS